MKGSVPAPEAGKVAEHRDDRWNARVANTSSVAGVGDSVYPLDGVYRDILRCVDDHDSQADAVGNIIQMAIRIEPADIEGIEGATGFAGRIVLRYRNHVDDRVAVGRRRAAHRAVLHSSATAHQNKQPGKKSSKQNPRSHRIPSLRFPFSTGFRPTRRCQTIKLAQTHNSDSA